MPLLSISYPEGIALLNADCYPVTTAPGLSRLFLDFCGGADSVRPYYATSFSSDWQSRPKIPAHWPELIEQLSAQNPGRTEAIRALREGAGTVVTGQQVALFGGPLFTPFKAATAIARARQAREAGHPHEAIFWLASEDHDFAEVNHVTFPARRELRKYEYSAEPDSARPVGGIVLGDEISSLVDQAAESLGASEALDALSTAWQPGRTFAQAFADFYSK